MLFGLDFNSEGSKFLLPGGCECGGFLTRWFLLGEVEDDFVVLLIFLGLFKLPETCTTDFSFLPVVPVLAVVVEGGGLITGAGVAGVVVAECGEFESHGGGGGGTEVVFEDKEGGSSCLVSFPQ